MPIALALFISKFPETSEMPPLHELYPGRALLDCSVPPPPKVLALLRRRTPVLGMLPVLTVIPTPPVVPLNEFDVMTLVKLVFNTAMPLVFAVVTASPVAVELRTKPELICAPKLPAPLPPPLPLSWMLAAP